jgi:hypothetical protein
MKRNDTPLFDEERYNEISSAAAAALDNFQDSVINMELRRQDMATAEKQELARLQEYNLRILQELDKAASGLEAKLIKTAGVKKRQPAKGTTKKPAGTKAASSKKKG